MPKFEYKNSLTLKKKSVLSDCQQKLLYDNNKDWFQMPKKERTVCYLRRDGENEQSGKDEKQTKALLKG